MAVSRTRRRLGVAVGSLAVLAVVLAGWWMHARFTLNAAERNLVGAWAQTRDRGANPGGVLVEFVVRENRTVCLVNRDAKTGAVTVALEECDRWGISDGVLTLRRRQEPFPAHRWFAWWDSPRRVESYDELRLVPDGPNRIRYTLLRADQSGEPLGEPLPTGTWVRLDAAK